MTTLKSVSAQPAETVQPNPSRSLSGTLSLQFDWPKYNPKDAVRQASNSMGVSGAVARERQQEAR